MPYKKSHILIEKDSEAQQRAGMRKSTKLWLCKIGYGCMVISFFLLRKSSGFIGQADLQDSHIGKGTEGIEERIEQMEETDESGRKSIRN